MATQPPGIAHERAQIAYALVVHERHMLFEWQHGALEEGEARASLLQLEQALQSARTRGWLRSEAELSQALTWRYLHLSSNHQAVEALEKLLTNKEWLKLLPVQKLYCYELLIRAAIEHQDLRRVTRYMAEVLHDARLLNDMKLADALSEIRAADLEELILTGDRTEIARKLGELQAAAEKASGESCDQQATRWGQLGWLQLLLVELGWAEDPVPALEKARALRASAPSCNPASALANVWANLARAQSAAWWKGAQLSAGERDKAVRAAKAALEQMGMALGSQPENEEVLLDRLLSEVRIGLMEGSPAGALARISELSRLTERKQWTLFGWLVAIHKAEALSASGRQEDAIAAFRKADKQLLPLLHHVPIYQARRLILSRFEYSHQRAIELAVRAGRLAEAMEILRLFDQQALASIHIPWWQEQEDLQRSPFGQRRRQEQDRCLALRTDYEKRISLVPNFTVAQCQDLNLLKSRWLESFDTVFAESTPAHFPPPPIPAGELLLGCARQQKEWICLSALDGVYKAVPIPSPELDAIAVEQIVLPALADEIQRAIRIRVLAHGRLAQLNLCGIKLEGAPLGPQKPIYYTADRPPVKMEPRAPHAALLVLKPGVEPIPELSLPAAQRWLAPALSDLHVMVRSAESITTPVRWKSGEALSPDVFADLQRSDVFIYFGHVAPMPCPINTVCCSDEGGLRPDERLTALQLGQDTSLSTADVLLAKRIPQRAFLLGCASTDRSTSTPTEMVGLAQSFALRGAQVLGFARKEMDAETAAEVLCALAQQRLDAPDFDFGSFLVDMQRRFYRGERCKAKGKWYSCRPGERGCSSEIHWEALRWYGP